MKRIAEHPFFGTEAMRTVRTPLVTFFLFGTFVLGGCKDLLGMKDLRFEERPAPSKDFPPEELGVGGEGTLPAPDPNFPLVVGPDVLVVASYGTKSFADFFVYSPEDGSLDAYEIEPSRVLSTRYQFVAGLSAIVEADGLDGPVLVGYEASTGFVHVANNWPTETTIPSERLAGTPHWSELRVCGESSAPKLLAYAADTGAYRLTAFPKSTTGEASPLVGILESPGESLECFNEADIENLLLVNGSSSSWSALRLEEAGPASLFSGTSSRKANIVLPLVIEDSPQLLEYATTTGAVARLSASASGDVLETEYWPAGYTDLVPLPVSEKPSVLAYNRETGTLAQLVVVPLEGAPVVVK